MDRQQLANLLAKDLFNMTMQEAREKQICINCKKPPTYKTEAGRKEYELSLLCEPCFDAFWAPDGQ